MRPYVSVIVPIYNVEKYLDRCIKSIVNQSLRNIEIILVDDGSPDRSPEICDKYAQIDNRIKVIHKKNEGLGFARNSGLEIASGEYVAFIDSDDYIELDMLEELYLMLKKNRADTVLSGFYKDIEEKILTNVHVFSNEVFNETTIKTRLLPGLIGADRYGKNHCSMSVCMGLYSMDIIKNNNIRFTSERRFISEDIIFDLDYYKFSKKVLVSEKCFYHYYLNTSSLTMGYKKDRFDKCVILYNKLVELTYESSIYSFCEEQLYNSLITNARICIMQESTYIRSNGFRKSWANIKNICDNQELKNALSKFKYASLPFKQKFFCKLMKNNRIGLLILVSIVNSFK